MALKGFTIGTQQVAPTQANAPAKKTGGALSSFSIGNTTPKIDVAKITPPKTDDLFTKSAEIYKTAGLPKSFPSDTYDPSNNPNPTAERPISAPGPLDARQEQKTTVLGSIKNTMSSLYKGTLEGIQSIGKDVLNIGPAISSKGNVDFWKTTLQKIYQPLDDAMNGLGFDEYNKQATEAANFDTTGMTNEQISNKVAQNMSTISNNANPTITAKVNDFLDSTLKTTNVLFSLTGVPSLLSAMDQFPVVGTLSKIVTTAFTGLGESGQVVNKAFINPLIDKLPISKSDKNNLKNTSGELLSLVYQFVGGEAVHIGSKKIKESGIIDAAREKLTKDIITQYNLPKTVYIDGMKVRDMFQTNKKITPEETAMIKDLGLTGEQYKNAMKNGITISIPAEKIVMITDKPYWAKVKELFNIPKSEAEVRKLTLNNEKSVAGPRALLEAPDGTKTIHPTVTEETKQSIKKIGPTATEAALVEKLKVTHQEAETIVRQVQATKTPEEIKKSIEETAKRLQLMKEAPRYTGKEVVAQAKGLGSDQGGLSDFTLNRIRKENYTNQSVKISDLIKSDPDLKEYIDSGEIREFEGEPFAMNPIVSSKGEVIDGYNRIAQALKNGEENIDILKGTATKREKPVVKDNFNKIVDLLDTKKAKTTKPPIAKEAQGAEEFVKKQTRAVQNDIEDIWTHEELSKLTFTTEKVPVKSLINKNVDTNLDEDTIQNLMEGYKRGDKIPPPILEGKTLQEGNARVEALTRLGIKDVEIIRAVKTVPTPKTAEAPKEKTKVVDIVKPKEAIKQKIAEKNPAIPEGVKEQLLKDFGITDINKATRKQLLDVLGRYNGEEMSLPYTEELFKKISSSRNGFVAKPDSARNDLFFGGEHIGVYTDSYLAIFDKTKGNELRNANIEAFRKKEIVSLMKTDSSLSHAEAEKVVDGVIESHIKQSIESFPTKQGIDEVMPKEPGKEAFPQVIQKITGDPVVVLSDGKQQVIVNADKLALLKKLFPDAKVGITGIDKPVTISEGDNIKAVVMPIISRGDEFPVKPDFRPGENIIEQPKFDQSIIEEAKKYNNLDDFIESSRDRFVIHGTDSVKNVNSIIKNGFSGKEIYVTKDYKTAIDQGGNYIVSALIKKGSKPMDKTDISDQYDRYKSEDLIPLPKEIKNEYDLDTYFTDIWEKNNQMKAPSGSGQADIGVFNEETPVLPGNVESINPIQTPEMVELVREVTGKYPIINSRLRRKLGVFFGRGNGEVQLNPSIFKNPIQVAKTLAHEIGHLVDFLPRIGIKRTSLLQKLYVIKNHLASSDLVKNKEIRDELWALSQYWRPLGGPIETIDPKFLSYRKSASELYADAISVLFNSPGLLEQRAPIFYKQFFATLEQKPEINEKYWELQDMLHGAKEELFLARENRIKAGFARAEEIQKGFMDKKEKAKSRLEERLRQQLDDRYFPALQKVQQAEKMGKIIDDSENPKYLLQELAYINNENYLLVDKLNKEISEPIREAGMSDDDLGMYLLLNRIATERKEIANPFGFDLNNAKDQLEYMRKTKGEDNFKLLQDKIKLFHDEVFKSVEKAVEVGSYNREMFETKIKPNKDNYATFAVVDYLQDYVPATIKKQVGTFKEVANPYHLTILKTAALNKLNALQEAKGSFIKILKDNFPKEIIKSGEIRTGRISIFKKNNEGLKPITILEDGKLKSYDVDPYIAESFKNEDPDKLFVGVKFLQKFNQDFKSLVTTYNLRFAAVFNPIRDIRRNYKLIPNANLIPIKIGKDGIKFNTAGNLLSAYIKSLPSAARYAKGELDAFTRQMVEDKLINAPMADYNYDPRDDGMGMIMQKYGILPKDTPTIKLPAAMEAARKVISVPVIKLLDAMRFVANTLEVVSKIAGTKVRMAGGETGKELAYNVRNYTGTPNYKVKGTQTTTTNEIFIFSNIMKEGIKSDAIIAFSPKTRSGYWWKTVKIDLMPKLLMFLGAAGLFGAKIKDMFDKMSEYDKTNYTTIPIGEDENGKAVYIRIPHDETGRLISAVFWKSLNMGKNGSAEGLQDIFALGAGQLPNVTPLLTILNGWMQYGQGKNPYDAFRGQPLMDDTTFQAGGSAANKKMLQWTMNTLGLSQFTTYDPSKNTTTETILKMTPLNGVIKISDYGLIEKSNKITTEVKKQSAQQTLEDRKIIDKYVKKYSTQWKNGDADEKDIADEATEEILGHYPETDEEIARQKSMRIKMKRALKIGAYDVRYDNLMYAASNKEKIAILKVYQSSMNPTDFNDLIDTAVDEGIISDTVYEQINP